MHGSENWVAQKCCNSRRTIDCKHLDGAASKYEAAAEVPDADFLHCKTVAHPRKLRVMSDSFASHHKLFCRNKICTIQQVGYVCTNAEGKWMWANQKDGSISRLGTASRRSVFRFLWGKCMGSRKMRLGESLSYKSSGPMLFHDTKTTTLPPWQPRAQNPVERLLPSHTHKKLRCKGECSWRPFFGSFWCFEMTSILWMVGLTNCKIFATRISKLRYVAKSRVRLKLRSRRRQVARRRGALALQWGKHFHGHRLGSIRREDFDPKSKQIQQSRLGN